MASKRLLELQKLANEGQLKIGNRNELTTREVVYSSYLSADGFRFLGHPLPAASRMRRAYHVHH